MNFREFIKMGQEEMENQDTNNLDTINDQDLDVSNDIDNQDDGNDE